MQNAFSSHVLTTHKPQREVVRGGNGDPREGNPRNLEVSPKPSEPVVRLRQVSELRACS